jgi:hypothetical protein
VLSLEKKESYRQLREKERDKLDKEAPKPGLVTEVGMLSHK